jgi:hypothetical protein
MKTLVAIMAVLSIIAVQDYAYSDDPQHLIRVKRADAQLDSQTQAAPSGVVEPTPRDQMYVFWILGRVINYPFDKAEALVTNFKNKRAAAAERQKLSDSSATDAVSWNEIPPAPPARRQ